MHMSRLIPLFFWPRRLSLHTEQQYALIRPAPLKLKLPLAALSLSLRCLLGPTLYRGHSSLAGAAKRNAALALSQLFLHTSPLLAQLL